MTLILTTRVFGQEIKQLKGHENQNAKEQLVQGRLNGQIVGLLLRRRIVSMIVKETDTDRVDCKYANGTPSSPFLLCCTSSFVVRGIALCHGALVCIKMYVSFK
jgi:hypothetical protein